jgi:hypothetical protein
MCTGNRRHGPATSSIAVSTTVLTAEAYAVPGRAISGDGYGSRREHANGNIRRRRRHAERRRTDRYAPAGDLNMYYEIHGSIHGRTATSIAR